MGSNRGHILVVDDSKINRMMLARAVEKQGHQVTTAQDGRQALALLSSAQAGPFDVILLDVLMPEMDGYQVLEQVKGDSALRHIPVIMISALDEMDSAIRCIEMGATDYLPKPFNPALLQARLDASLAEKRLRDLELEYLEQVNRVVGAAEAVEAATFDPDSLSGVAAREDALGQLARVFQRMAREVHLREQRLKQHLQQLHLDVEEMKRAITEPLYVYMPMDRRQTLVRGETLPDRTSGAALFADISGFTPLTAALAQELGPQRGAEELARLLNQVYGALIAEVHRYGGSVIGFGGDAITCWMDEGTASPPRSGGSVTARPGPGQAPSASPPLRGGSVTARPGLGQAPSTGSGQAGLRAIACGLAMQNAMAQFASIATPTGTSFSLAIKVAVVVGPARRFLVGDPQVQNLEVIAGQTLDLLARAEHHAQRGEVVVDANVVDQATGQIAVAEWRTEAETGQRIAVISGLAKPVAPAPWPDLVPDCLPEAQCRPWLLPGVYKRLCSGTKQFLAELRPTAALFLSFKGIDYDLDDQAGEKLDAYVRWVQAEIERYGGSLLQVIVGDKGSHLLAAFGAPVAHHDDEVRAVSAALALQSTPPEFKFITGVQIGVAQGQMRVGTCGSTARRTYGLQGDKVNLAARLMQAATDGMLCDEAIYRTAQARLVFAPLPAIKVKGKIEPVAVYRPTGEKRHLTRSQARLIGRTAECVLLRESLQSVLHGTGCIVIVEGEAGIGKSRLIAELRQQAETMQVTTLSVVGDAAEKSTPFYAWRDVFRKLVNLGSHPDPDEQRQRLTDLLQDQPEHLQLVPLLNPVLSLALTDTEVTASLTGQAQADRTRDLLIALLQSSLKQSPKAIFVENAQDLDPASWTLTLAVSQRLPSLLLVIAARPLPEPLSTGYARLQQAAHVQTLSLKALSPDEAYLLACEHLGAGSLPKPVVELLRKAAGNPSVIEELVYQLRDDGYITVADGKCQVAPDVDLQDIVFPTTAQAVIISRIDRLSPSEQLTLKVASVIGRVFSRQILYDVFPVASDKPHLDKHLQTLEQLDLIAQNVPQPTYTFKNLLTQEAAYNSMLYSQRRQLHRLVAEWHERTFRDNADSVHPAEGVHPLAPYYATLAHHWCQADDPAKAIDYLEKASQRALRNGAYQEAERLLQESLELDARSGVLSVGFYDRVST